MYVVNDNMRCVCGPCPTRDCGVHAAVHFLPQPPPGAPCPRPRPMYDAHAPSLQRSAHLAARRAHPATLTSSACRVSLPRCHAAAMPVPHCSPLPRRHPAAIRVALLPVPCCHADCRAGLRRRYCTVRCGSSQRGRCVAHRRHTARAEVVAHASPDAAMPLAVAPRAYAPPEASEAPRCLPHRRPRFCSPP